MSVLTVNGAVVASSDVPSALDPRFPTTGEKAALAGSDGTPGGGNKFVTETGLAAALTTGRVHGTYGPTVTAAATLVLGDGNVFEVDGSDEIHAIDLAGWQAGDVVHLFFGDTPTVKNNTAGAAGSGKLKLAKGVDYLPNSGSTAPDCLTLVLEPGNSWREPYRPI